MIRSPFEIPSPPSLTPVVGRCRSVVCGMVVLVLTGTGCATHSFKHGGNSPGVASNDHLVMPVLWAQSSAEARAVYYQTFITARYALDQALREMKADTAPPAIVVDIDDTMLSSTPYQASLVSNGGSYPEGWAEWSKAAKATALPGGAEFLSYASGRGVEVFYITNRGEAERLHTLKNLAGAGFPNADSAHLLPRDRTSNKEARRRQVMRTHTIVLLLGDTLEDFSSVFHHALPRQRQRNVDWMKDKWGTRFIVLPNPMYGGWENALYDNDPQLSSEQKDSIRKGALDTF